MLRARRLAQSVARHNRDKLEFYVSAPIADLPLFREQLAGIPHTLLDDQDILRRNPRLDLARIAAMPGYRSQQVVKSEFWRLDLCENYVCLDSDSYFIRDFGARDFLTAAGAPYTVMAEAKEFFQYLVNIGQDKHVRAAATERQNFEREFPGIESRYRFGPTPVVWSRRVWSDLDTRLLAPRGETLADAIERFPSELHWYGGALLNYQGVPLMPREPLFRLYGYIEEYWRARRLGETEAKLAANYLGVTRQSSWDKGGDFDRQKRIRRAIRKGIKYLFGRW